MPAHLRAILSRHAPGDDREGDARLGADHLQVRVRAEARPDTGRRRLQAEADGERLPRCGRDVAQIQPRYSPDTAQMWPRCGPDVAQMWPRCGRGCGGAPCSFLRAVAPSCRISGSPPPLQVAHKFFKRSRETLSMKMAIPLRAALLGFETSRGPERTREDPRVGAAWLRDLLHAPRRPHGHHQEERRHEAVNSVSSHL